MSAFPIQDGETMVLIGDSITDCGRRDPAAAPFGNGYVALFIDLVTARYPERRIRFVNKGISGNTVLDLEARWDADVLAERPDWLSVMIGINDLHRTLNGVFDIPPAIYRERYTRILTRVAAPVAGNGLPLAPQLILLEPFYMITESEADAAQKVVLGLLPGYIEVVHDLAERFGARLVRLQDMFQRQLRHRPFTAFCGEPVHPNRTGHLLIAHGLLRTLEG
ncbi:MAG: SGNH/GDSL hydrolase family protein [Planctomycetes bacterium]|nr:SGNH/GDSL hydrolase family protein [Planctomycetota bacterium]